MSDPGRYLERDDPQRLDGKTCLVTGSSRGIGRAIALEFARMGAETVVNYRSSAEEAKEVAGAIEDYGGDAIAVQADVADREDVAWMCDEIHDEFGRVNVLVNNAGITVDRKFEDMTREDWDRVIDVNLGGTFNCTKEFFEDIRETKHGRLINVSSVVGQQGNYGQANYATSKGGQFAFTRTIALELATSGSTANVIAPGFTETDMLEKVPERVQENIRSRIPLNRFATPEDLVGMVRFLASDESAYMTGQVLGINGGLEW